MADLGREIKALREEGATLGADEAARRWVALMDAWLTSPAPHENNPHQRPSIEQVVAALPLSSAWDSIAALVKTRKTDSPAQDESFRLLVAILRGDSRSTQRALDYLVKKRPEPKLPQNPLDNQGAVWPQQIARTLDALEVPDSDVIRDFEQRLTRFEKKQSAPDLWDTTLSVPDLLRLCTEKKAVALLTRALKAGPRSLHIEGRATEKLAAALALQHIASLQHPLWHLVRDLDQAPLYEAMAAQFPAPSYLITRSDADAVYLLALVSEDRVDDAVQFIQTARGSSPLQISVPDLYKMGRPELPPKVYSFLDHLLSRYPALPYWDKFIQLASGSGQSQKALKLLQATLAAPALLPETRREMQSIYFRGLLATDRREEGVQQLRHGIQAGLKPGATDYEADDLIRLCSELASLGRLLQRPDLVSEALKLAVQSQGKPARNEVEKDWNLRDLASLLIEHGQGAAAEKMILSHLAARSTQKTDEETGPFEANDLLALLALHYHQAGRPQDVLKVFETMSGWNSTDLTGLEECRPNDHQLFPIVVRALAASGRQREAHEIIRRMVLDYPSMDAGYELMLEFGSAQPMGDLFDELARQHPFEERPLIWKAQFLLNAGQTDLAEQTARAAIAMDPSDGDQGKGDRARAYSVLGDALERKDAGAEAAKMRRVVSAIRKAEEADDWHAAGLKAEAARRYVAALLEFDDAYCIQARLALRLNEIGHVDEAARHYRRAFELMPDSFGRKESHCFGCEGVFKGATVQIIADQVLGSRATQPPVRPQVHYLLGQLRESQRRTAEAAEAYRQAVQADPAYRNAWNKLASLAAASPSLGILSPAEGEQAALQSVQLDPDSTFWLNQVRDLRKLWDILLKMEKSKIPPEKGPLLPLTAARKRIESKPLPDAPSPTLPQDQETGVRKLLFQVDRVRLASLLLAAQPTR